MKQVVANLRERLALGTGRPRMIPGGASFAYVFGTVLVLLLVVQAVTGIALAAFYSPSSTDAWASVAYLEDQAALGWLVRGLHYHGGSALVVIAGLHLVQTAVAGAYKKPRELVWWLGIVLLLLLLAWAVTGFVLRWDQAGYWANRVEIGIAAGTPLIGPTIQSMALGGNDYGNLTLTRFYTLHVIVLPAVVTLVTVIHIVLARRHGTTPVREGRAAPRWPDQVLRDVLAMTVVVAIMLAVVVTEGGIGLAAPADPTQAYDARPLWYFRWLFELRELAGSAEQLAAMAAPAIVGGYLVALPLLDRGADRAPLRRLPWLGALAGLLAIVGGLTVMSLVRDSGDADLSKRRAQASLR
nr:cytochrome bc complex cytochrome b subunit [Deltaproteobacteria bacterium]